MKKENQTFTCKYCGKIVSANNTRCIKCAGKIRSELRPRLRFNCVDCGKEIVFGGKRCRPCWGVWKTKAYPRVINKCIDCGKQLSYQGYSNANTRCKSCWAKWHVKNNPNYLKNGFKKGKLNPSYTGNEHRECAHICTPRYNKWRKKVYERDDYTCQLCDVRGGKLQAHHKKSWMKYPKLRYHVSNGITLCINCHKKLHKSEIENPTSNREIHCEDRQAI